LRSLCRKSVPPRLAPVRLAPDTFAWPTLAALMSVCRRSAPLRLAPFRFACAISEWRRVALLRSTRLRSAPLRIDWLRAASESRSCLSDERKSVPPHWAAGLISHGRGGGFVALDGSDFSRLGAAVWVRRNASTPITTTTERATPTVRCATSSRWIKGG